MENFDDLLNSVSAEEQNGAPPQLSKEDYAEKKKAEREEVFALSDSAAMEVAADDEKFEQFLDVQGQFDRYSAVNALLIMAQKPEASRLGSFDYWKQRNCSIRPGQTAISILEPHEYTKEDGSTGIGYNVRKVFDISQADTRKLKASPSQSYTERQLLQALILKAPVKITGVDELPDDAPSDLGAITDPATGDIAVRKGMEFSDTFRCLAQELSYVEINRSAEDTPSDQDFTSYGAAYLLCKKYGVDTKSFDFENTSEYFGGMEAQDVKRELSDIRNAAESISGRMAHHLEAQQKAARSGEAR